jgi:hypothetical protein
MTAALRGGFFFGAAMKLTMKKTLPFAHLGYEVKEYAQGTEVDTTPMPDAEVFQRVALDNGFAEKLVTEPKAAKPVNNKAKRAPEKK